MKALMKLFKYPLTKGSAESFKPFWILNINVEIFWCELSLLGEFKIDFNTEILLNYCITFIGKDTKFKTYYMKFILEYSPKNKVENPKIIFISKLSLSFKFLTKNV